MTVLAYTKMSQTAPLSAKYSECAESPRHYHVGPLSDRDKLRRSFLFHPTPSPPKRKSLFVDTLIYGNGNFVHEERGLIRSIVAKITAERGRTTNDSGQS